MGNVGKVHWFDQVEILMNYHNTKYYVKETVDKMREARTSMYEFINNQKPILY